MTRIWNLPAAAMLLALAVAISACSPAMPPAPTTAPSKPADAAKPAAEKAAPKAADPSAGSAPAKDAPADWQAKWDQALQGAKREGTVVVVTHTNLLYRELLQSFREKHPDIQVEHVSIRPSEFAPKVVTEQQNGSFGYDVWLSPTSAMTEVVLPAGGFEKLTPFLILPEVTDPKNYRGGKLLFGAKEPYTMLNRGNLTGDVWVNRDVAPESEFNSIDQLIDPKFKGKLMIRTPNTPMGATLAMTGFLHVKGEDFLWKIMKDQDPVYIENARLLTQNLINGKYPLALGSDQATIDNCKTAGGCQNLEYVRGYPHMLGQGANILKSPPHPNAATVFFNWFFTKDGQEAFKQGILKTEPPPFESAHSIRVDVEPHPDAIANATMPDYAKLDQYSLQGMEQGAEEIQKVIEIYNKIEAGQSR